jgi:hypothetical protein
MSIANQAWLTYVDEIRRDPGNLYYCARVMEKGYLLSSMPDGDELMRKIAITVYTFDPRAYLTIFPHAIRDFSDEELEKLTAVLSINGDDDLTNYIRGKLWSDLAHQKDDPDKYARRGYEFLTKVSAAFADKEPEYLQALAECCGAIDYEAYKAIVPRLLDSREPEWRGHELISALRTAVSHNDWDTYRAWRAQWDQLPVNAHLCECSLNKLSTFDGIYALEQNDIVSIPELLRKAVDLRGCPHLNTGAASLGLVERLVERNILLNESLEYIKSCSQFCAEDERIQVLRKRIEASLQNSASH